MSDELDPRARAILAASREADALPEDVRGRVWQRVEADVAGPSVGRRVWIPAIMGLALAAAIAALWWGRSALDGSTRTAVGAAPYGRAPASAPSPAAVPIPAELPATVPASAQTSAPSEPDAPARRDARARPTSAPAAAADPFADELARLRAAQSTLATAPAAVIEQLDALDRDHPRGALQPERAALRVFATCESGAIDGARALAARFADRYPTSPLLGRVRSACTEPTP